MKKGLVFPLWILFCITTGQLAAQQRMIDSLLNITRTTQNDTIRIRAFITLGELSYETSPAKAIEYWTKTADMANKKGRNAKETKALGIMRGESINNMAVVRYYQGNTMAALDLNFQSLKIREDINDIHGMAESMNNIANVYMEQGDTVAGLDFLKKSSVYYSKINDLGGVGYTYSNMAKVYARLHKDTIALSYLFKAIDLLEKKPYLRPGLSAALNAVGNIYRRQKRMKLARQYLFKALRVNSVAKDAMGTISTLGGLASYYHQNNQPDSALYYAQKAMDNPHQNFLDVYSDVALISSQIYQRAGKFDEALKNYQLHILLRDSITNNRTQKSMIKNQLKYQYANQVTTDSLKRVQQVHDGQLQLEKAQTRQYALYAVVLVILVFSVFLYTRFRLIRRQKNIIQLQKSEVEHQRDIVAEKQKEIIDSINYAKRIQYAILAKEEDIKTHFPQSFLMYRPKDIVAGDFYFFETTATHVFYAAADCTGHGVPGALVSVVCSNALTRCIKEFGLTEPGKILDKTRELVVETFRKSGKDVKDGMDISLISIDLNDLRNLKDLKGNGDDQIRKSSNHQISWAGANNPLWIIRPGDSHLTEIKADKQPIGFSEIQKPFTTHTVSVAPQSLVFLFTDGYADQFGGQSGKKMKTANFQKLLVELRELDMAAQYQQLENGFNKWKGEYEQLDDVCVIGIQL